MYKTFKEMPVWQKAMEIANTPAALSISANIAEGYGRSHSNDKVNFYHISRGSVTEVQSHLEYGKKVGYINPESAEKLDAGLMDIYQSLNKLIIKLSSERS